MCKVAELLHFWQILSKSSPMTTPQEEKNSTQASTQKGGTKQAVKELDQLEIELAEAQNAKLRALADLQNFQRREAENKASWTQMGIAEFLQNILPRLLELRLGAEHSSDKDMQKAVAQFFGELQKQGLSSIEPKAGDPIDPHVHEVLMAEEGTPGTVVRVLEPGWKYGETVLRPAKISGAQH